jgi:hypothetical protein
LCSLSEVKLGLFAADDDDCEDLFDMFAVEDIEKDVPARAAKAKPANSNITSTVTGGINRRLNLPLRLQ